MHNAPLSLLSVQPLKLIFTLLHITAALLLVYYFGILFSCAFFCSLWELQSRGKSSAQSLLGSRPCHKHKPHPATSPSCIISTWALGCTGPSVYLTEFCNGLPSQTFVFTTSPSPNLFRGWWFIRGSVTCTLFHAASPLSFTQFSSLSGDPRAPCLVSTHRPVPTLRIWNSKLVTESPTLIKWQERRLKLPQIVAVFARRQQF